MKRTSRAPAQLPGRVFNRLDAIRDLLLAFLAINLLVGVVQAQTESVLYAFCFFDNCTDGDDPQASPIFDTKGNLYATASEEGYGGGTVLRIRPSGGHSVIYHFCSLNNCTDGDGPVAGLIFDKKGNLYGTTGGGGAYGAGTVFKLTPSGHESVIYSFCPGGYPCTDGAGPSAGLIFDKEGNLYGTTYEGGVSGFAGTVFKVTPSGHESVLYSFCAQSGCTDGEKPWAGLVFDKQGNLYGTTVNGGANGSACYGDGCGTVFKVTPSGHESVLYSFDGGDDGAFPYANLVFDKKSNLYGTASGGGTYNWGTVFKVTFSGKESVLYSFCKLSDCDDGANPVAGLIFDKEGDLYGTALDGGISAGGVVFKLVP